MKRGVLLFIFLLIIPIVHAEIKINGPQKDTFNLGDEIIISGYVLRESGFSGFLKLALICDNDRVELPLTSLSLLAGERKLFPNDFSIPKIVANKINGDCSIEALLISGTETLETIKSSDFIISKSLQGSFDIDKVDIQSGSSFTLTGGISKLDGNPTEGSAELYFEGGNNSFLVDVISLSQGKLEFVYSAIPLASDTYNIDVIVNDVFGNIELFDDVASFNLVSELDTIVKVEKSRLTPGDDIDIFGEVKNIYDENIQEGVAKISFEGARYTVEIKEGKFEKTIPTDNKIKSGKLPLKVIAEDSLGNSGLDEIIITIQPEYGSLGIDLNKEIFNPKEVVSINPLLYDQAGYLVVEEATIEILDSKKDIVFSEVTKINNKVDFNIPQFIKPGTYKILITVQDLEEESQFEVDEIIDSEIILDNQTLIIHNIGNVDYEKPIKVDLGDHRIIRRTNIRPNETELIYLFEEVTTGKYDLLVTYGNNKKSFNDIQIIGRPKKSFNVVYTLLMLVLFGLFLYLFIKKREKIPKIRKKHKGIHTKVEVKTKPSKHEKKTLKHRFGMASEEDLKDFKKKVTEEIKKTVDHEKEDKKGESDMFGMFK
ncbi:MAG: hypothetical protein QGF74_00935 [Candidatus Nanoarchaeia archaeon]|jgi:hypothetical protein|nr:hypothetical protein [Candidatus Nanoarchaeia archaeon]|tara:strand:- start:6970 stop:8766 length:1797 start_codon:yes stop_codon:yes gene_type:complete